MLTATIMAVVLFVFILVAGNAVKEVIGLVAAGRLPWDLFAYLLAILIPGVIPYALPLGLLFATLLVLGRMSSQNEILAIKASGLSLWRIAAPICLIAMLGTLLALIIGFYYAPLADSTYRKTLANVVRHDPIRFIEPRTFIKDFPGFIIFVETREGEELRDFNIWELGEEGKVRNFVQAKSGRFTYAEDQDAIILTLSQGSGERRRSDDLENLAGDIPLATFDELALRLPLDKILGTRATSRKLSFHTLNELLALHAATFEAETDDPEAAFKRRIEIQTVIQKKIAHAFSVLALCLFAIPLGIKASRSETYANLALALALALVYYMLTIAISWVEKTPGLRPDLMVWIPNFLFQAFGLIFLWRTNRH